MGRIKQYRKGKWEDVTFKQYRKGTWQKVDVYQFRKGVWEKISGDKITETWSATWSQTYAGNNSQRTDSKGNKLYQGSHPDYWGIQKSLCGFNIADIKAKLAGASILDVQLYLRNQHWYYGAGGKVYLGYHNHITKPNTFSQSVFSAKSQSYSARGQAQWINMPVSFGTGLRDGKYSGFSIDVNSASIGYYGYFYGANDGANAPKLKITYEK